MKPAETEVVLCIQCRNGAQQLEQEGERRKQLQSDLKTHQSTITQLKAAEKQLTQESKDLRQEKKQVEEELRKQKEELNVQNLRMKEVQDNLEAETYFSVSILVFVVQKNIDATIYISTTWYSLSINVWNNSCCKTIS